MRSIRISVGLFLLMAAVVCAGVIMNYHVCTAMTHMLNRLPEQAAAIHSYQVEELESFWQTWQKWMRPTMNPNIWRSVNDLVGDVCLYGRVGESAAVEYAAARQRLLAAIKEMSRPERVAHGSLFG